MNWASPSSWRSVTRLGTGRSRAMYRLSTTHGLRLVARVEQGGLFGTRTADEVVGTRGLRAAGVPVAEVVAVDEAGHVLGHPMFVMEFVRRRRRRPDHRRR